MCYVAGSTLLADHVSASERGRAQGAGDVMIALASGGGSFAVGYVFASGGYLALSVICAVLCFILAGYTWYCAQKNR